MSSRQRASEQITEAVTAWPQRGARSERRVRLHAAPAGDRSPAPGLRRPLRLPAEGLGRPQRAGRIEDHRVFRGRPGLAARRIETESDVDDVIALLRLNYDRLLAREREPVDTAA